MLRGKTPLSGEAMHPTEDTPYSPKQNELAEFQGLYGSYHVTEILLQKIWLRREFAVEEARTGAGEPVVILDPGRWNRLAGPDFLGARLRIGDREVHGDVEVHFRAEAWNQHGHDRDPAYDNVVLHVLLFPVGAHGATIRTRSGREVPSLALMDLLWHDLEEYATDDAVAALSRRDPWPALEQLLGLPPAERDQTLLNAAGERWSEKCHFASLRVRRLGWAEACHQTTLEILGYRANRAGMLKVANLFPLASWREHAPEVEDALAAAEDAWSLRGVRPANHPRTRLGQYRRWVESVPDWPARLLRAELPDAGTDDGMFEAGQLRRQAGMPGLRTWFERDLCGGCLGGTRLDTWIINLALPFLAAADREAEAKALWMAWYPGDIPDGHREAARQLTNGRKQPMSNGLMQAIIGLQLEQWRAEGAMPAEDSVEPDGRD